MSEILILARVQIPAVDLPIVADYYFEVGKRLTEVEGFNGVSVWRDQRGAESYLVCYDYSDLDSAERGLAALSEIRILAEVLSGSLQPADVQRLRVASRSQIRISEAPQSSCLSMSIRVADPGYGSELVAEVERVFDELQLITGYLGSLCATNDALDEEVFGLVTWASREAFVSSLPPGKKPTQIVLYTRFY